MSKSGSKKKDANFSGAGIIPIEMYYDKTTRAKKISVILFKSCRSNRYCDGGGTRGYNEDARTTAAREFKEESANTFRLNKKHLDYNFSIMCRSYIAFFVIFKSHNDIYRKCYKDNIAMLHRNSADNVWLETDDITKIYVDDLVKSGVLGAREHLSTVDVNGKSIIVDRRAVVLISSAIYNGVININKIPIINLKQNNDMIYKGSNSFLNGTISYRS